MNRKPRRVRTGTLIWNPETRRHESEWRISGLTDVCAYFFWEAQR